MKKEDFKKGKIYQSYWGANKHLITIGRISKNGEDYLSSDIYEGKAFCSSYSDIRNFNSATKNATPATPDQIKWLEACEKANKFIPFDKVIRYEDSYDIFH